MKASHQMRLWSVFVWFNSCLWFAGLASAAPTQFESQPLGHKVKVAGEYQAEQLGPWKLEGVVIQGTLSANREALFQGQTAQAELNVNVKIPVRSLFMNIRVRDAALREWMGMDKHPNVTFAARNCTLHEPADDGTVRVDFKGDLVLAGITNRVTVPATITPADGQGLKISGQMNLQLSDFNIRPDRFFMYRYEDEMVPVPGPKSNVKVEFVWCVRPKKV